MFTLNSFHFTVCLKRLRIKCWRENISPLEILIIVSSMVCLGDVFRVGLIQNSNEVCTPHVVNILYIFAIVFSFPAHCYCWGYSRTQDSKEMPEPRAKFFQQSQEKEVKDSDSATCTRKYHVLPEKLYPRGCEKRSLFGPIFTTGTQGFWSQKRTLGIRNFHQQISTDMGDNFRCENSHLLPLVNGALLTINM